jgi:hypothetical protein
VFGGVFEVVVMAKIDEKIGEGTPDMGCRFDVAPEGTPSTSNVTVSGAPERAVTCIV